ncbi:hypothetical protein ACFLZ0_03250, partial [Patescibacteria group bacterium]
MKSRNNLFKKKILIFSLISILITIGIFVFSTKKAKAATEFVSSIQQSGGDYSTLSSWEAAAQSDISATSTAVYSGTKTGTLSQGDTLELFRGGTYQNATSTFIADTSAGQLLVSNIYPLATSTLQANDQWRLASSTDNMWTVTGSGTDLGDRPIVVAQIDGSWTAADTTAVTIDGWTTDANHYIKVYTTATARHNGIYTGDGGKSTAYRLAVANAQGIVYREAHVRIDGLQIEITSASGDAQGPIYSGGTFVAGDRLDVSNCILKGHGNTDYYEAGIDSANNITRYTWNTIIYNISLNANSVGIDARYLDYIYNCT